MSAGTTSRVRLPGARGCAPLPAGPAALAQSIRAPDIAVCGSVPACAQSSGLLIRAEARRLPPTALPTWSAADLDDDEAPAQRAAVVAVGNAGAGGTIAGGDAVDKMRPMNLLSFEQDLARARERGRREERCAHRVARITRVAAVVTALVLVIIAIALFERGLHSATATLLLAVGVSVLALCVSLVVGLIVAATLAGSANARTISILVGVRTVRSALARVTYREMLLGLALSLGLTVGPTLAFRIGFDSGSPGKVGPSGPTGPREPPAPAAQRARGEPPAPEAQPARGGRPAVRVPQAPRA